MFKKTIFSFFEQKVFWKFFSKKLKKLSQINYGRKTFSNFFKKQFPKKSIVFHKKRKMFFFKKTKFLFIVKKFFRSAKKINFCQKLSARYTARFQKRILSTLLPLNKHECPDFSPNGIFLLFCFFNTEKFWLKIHQEFPRKDPTERQKNASAPDSSLFLFFFC